MPFDMPDTEIDEPGDLKIDVEYVDRFEVDMELTDRTTCIDFWRYKSNSWRKL